jgi:hypothetical protein
VKRRLGGWLGVSQLEQEFNGGRYPAGNSLSAEGEESPLLEALTGKRLVNADWGSLACALVIYKVWRLAMAILLLVATSCVYK